MKRKIRLSRRGTSGPKDCPLALVNVRTGFGNYAPVLFCFDTCADVSALPAAFARSEGIPYPRDEASRRTASGLVGSTVAYRGAIHLRIFGENFSWPCHFLEAAGPGSLEPYGVIGRTGFLSAFAFCIDEPYFTLRRRGQFWNRFLPPWSPRHDVKQPI